MSEDLKKEFSKDMSYTWSHTYITLSEWSKIFDSELERFRKKVTERIMKGELTKIDEKLNLLLIKSKDPFYEPPKKKKKKDEEDESLYYEESLDYLWDEEFWDLMMIRNEINRAHALTEHFGYHTGEEIRIIYYLS